MSFHFSSLYCSSYFPPPTDLERNKSASMKAGRTSSHFCREPTTQMLSLPQESGVALHHRSLPAALRMTSAARRKAMGIGGGAVLFFADDGDGLAGEFLTVAASSTCLRARRWCFRLSCRLPGCLGVASRAESQRPQYSASNSHGERHQRRCRRRAANSPAPPLSGSTISAAGTRHQLRRR